MHCPKNKLALPRKKPHLIEGTQGNLTEQERDAITISIQEGWSNGHLAMGTHAISYNLIVTRYSNN